MDDSKIKREYIKNYFIYLIIVNGILYLCLLFFHSKKKEINNLAYSPNISRITIGNGDYAKIGIISDLQIEKSKFFVDNTYRALKVLKKNNVDIIIIAGDISNQGKVENFILFNKIYKSIYNDSQKPILISIMGNHDYYNPSLSDIQSQNNFFYYIKSYPYSHYILES